jgi:arylsulfatase A-like enzyme
VDDGIGRVLAALDKYGLDDNTLVVLTSDQGSLYGQHGLWGNTSAWWPPSVYDEGMRVPLIFRHPDNIAAGSQTETLVNQFDFLPTVLDYLGFDDVEIPQSAGKSYAAVMTGSDSANESSDIFFEYMTVRVIRTERWLYQKSFLLGADALFDLDADPHQHQNLAEDADYSSVVEELDSRLMAFFARVADPRYDLWQGGTAKLKLFDGGDDKMFAEEFPGWQPPGLGFEQTVFGD